MRSPAPLLTILLLLLGLTGPAVGQRTPTTPRTTTTVDQQDLPENPAQPVPEGRRLRSLYLTLTFTFLLFVAFLVGSYLLIRVGRRLHRTPEPGPTTYVDAWSQARVSEDEIEAATREEDAPSDGDDRPPLA